MSYIIENSAQREFWRGTAGRTLVPLGISKIRATPTWALYSIAASVLLFTVLYWICDLKQWQRWAVIIRPAGSNTLLTYLLPDLWYFLLSATGFTYLEMHFNTGWPELNERSVSLS